MLALVFTDIQGSTALAVELGNEAFSRVRDTHFARGEHYAARLRGYVVKTTGDGLLVVFRSAPDALDFAQSIVRDPGDSKLVLRAAAHVGLVDIISEDVRGTPAHFAARLLSSATGGEIALSDDAKRQIDEQRAARHAAVRWTQRKREFKGFPGVQTIWVAASR
jgi:class 3 adenylate cyclase